MSSRIVSSLLNVTFNRRKATSTKRQFACFGLRLRHDRAHRKRR
jgi:hypothetical protein